MHRGWAVLLCAYLLGWVPLDFAVELLGAVPSLGMRGAPAVAELAVHGIAAMLCATAGWMVWTRAPAGRPVAAAAVDAAGATAIQSLFWTALPSSLAPGERWPLTALAAANTLFWLLLIARARRAGVS
jgi:hypothetical protein